MSSVSCNQHTVSRSYLKNFVSNGTKCVWRYDTKENRIDKKHRSIDRITREKFFYDLQSYNFELMELKLLGGIFGIKDTALENAYNDKQLIEKLFSLIEHKMADMHKNLFKHIDGKLDCDTEIFRTQYATFLVIQGLRTVSMRGIATNLNENEKKSILPFKQYADNERHLGMVQDLVFIFNNAKSLVEDYNWRIIKTKIPSFFTSDNPAMGAVFLPAVIYFPISPYACWRLEKFGSTYEGEDFNIEEVINWIITWSVTSASRYLYASCQSLFCDKVITAVNSKNLILPSS